MTIKIECKSKDCTVMILPSTAKKTGGTCMPCNQKTSQRENEEHVQKNKKDVDLFKGVTDCVEILIIMHQSRVYDATINYTAYQKSITELYAELSEPEMQRLFAYVVDNTQTAQKKIAFDILNEIAAFTDQNIDNFHQILLKIHHYHPGYTFRDANIDVVLKLIDRIIVVTNHRESRLELNNILVALAWIDSDKVVAQFVEWQKNPPNWQSHLPILPERYANYAGWELDQNSERRELTLSKCYPMIQQNDHLSDGPVTTCTTTNKTCQWCEHKLSNLFEFDLTNQVLDFLPYTGRQLIITTCETCAAYSGKLFMQIIPNGDSEWSPYNKKPENLPILDEEYERLPPNNLGLSSKARLPHHSADWCLPTTLTQVGGIPSWINDSDYPHCPECHKTMLFISQLAIDEIKEYSEGIYYCFLCPTCSISNVRYQQS